MTDDAQGQNLHARRASSFGGHARAYTEHRPDYPRAAVGWAVEPVADLPGLRVLDLGAGTGKLTEVLLRCGFQVTAVEPDAGMLAELRHRMPRVDARQGSAEAIPAPDASFDAVLVGQAFHWFDHDRALPEIGRVLRPGGVLAALWNRDDDRVEWVAGLQEVARGDAAKTRGFDQRLLPAHSAFGGWELAEFPHSQRRTADSLTATIGTHSHTLVIPPDERAALLGRIRGYLASRPETGSGEFELPMVTLTVRCARLPGPRP